MFGLYDMFSGGNLSKVTIFALASCPTSARRSFCSCSRWSGRTWNGCREKASSAAARSRIHALLDRGLAIVQSLSIAIFLERRRSCGRASAGLQPRMGLPPVVRPDADDRHDLHHVARRADHRAWCRQRHVAADLRGHRRRISARHAADVRPDADGQISLFRSAPAGDDGRRDRRDHLRRAGPPADRGAVRQARRRPPSCPAARARTSR